jgi:hypothetical protein
MSEDKDEALNNFFHIWWENEMDLISTLIDKSSIQFSKNINYWKAQDQKTKLKEDHPIEFISPVSSHEPFILDLLSEEKRSKLEKEWEFPFPFIDLFKSNFVCPLHKLDKSWYYKGEWNPTTGEIEGRGVVIKANKCTIDGYFYGKLKGIGRIIYDNFDRYVGEFKDGKPDGKGWLSKNFDKNVYVGIFVRGKFVKGLLKWSKITYIGEFKNYLLNGQAKIEYLEGEEYTGEVKDSMRHGHGIFRDKEGTTYEGIWERDFLMGQGSSVDRDGVKYKGEFWFGKRNGQGELFWGDPPTHKYVGSFINDVKHGYGVYEDDKLKYSGEFKEDWFNGKARVKFSNGEIFEGSIYNELFQEEGVFIDGDGASYEGSFKDGKFNGYGVLFTTSGRRIEGEWQESKPKGQYKVTVKNGFEWMGVANNQ